jgi:phosphopantetheinyl transferase
MHGTFTYCYASIQWLRPIFDADAADWLTAGERRALEQFRDLSRRQTWLSGRLTAKRLIASRLAGTLAASAVPHVTGWSYRDIEIRSAGRPPCIFVHGQRLNWSLSIAHTCRAVVAALCCAPSVAVGVDLAEVCRPAPGFARTWFTPAERRWLATDDPRGHAVVWAAKEATYKAAGRNHRFDPRLIEVFPTEDGYAARVRGAREDHHCRLSIWQTPEDEIAVFAAADDQSPFNVPVESASQFSCFGARS